MSTAIEIGPDIIREFCHRNGIIRLAVFGSVLRDDFREDSDVDVLVEFGPQKKFGLISLGEIRGELSDVLNRDVDMNLPTMLAPEFKDEVLREAQTLYVAS